MQLTIGAWVKCSIGNRVIPIARLQREKGVWFLCQNFKSGSAPDDTFGFKCGWTFTQRGAEGEYNSNVDWIEPIGLPTITPIVSIPT